MVEGLKPVRMDPSCRNGTIDWPPDTSCDIQRDTKSV